MSRTKEAEETPAVSNSVTTADCEKQITAFGVIPLLVMVVLLIEIMDVLLRLLCE